MNKSRVFCVNEPLFSDGSRVMNLKPATAFGELIFILPPGSQPMDPEASLPALREALSDFTQDDYLLLVGELWIIAAAAAMASHATGGPIKFLKWDRDQREYFKISADIDLEPQGETA